MERVNSKKMSQLGLLFPVLMILVFYIPDIVSGQIGVNCGSGAIVGQPYNMECTDIPDTVNNGVNIFLEGEVNSIIFCFKSKNCVARDDSQYSVLTPHNESLFFTILDVTTDDIDKKLYCVDDNTLSTSDPSCTLESKQTTDCVGCLSVVVIVVIVIVVIVVCGAVIIIIVCICKKKKKKNESRSRSL